MDAKISSSVSGWVIIITPQRRGSRHVSGQRRGSSHNGGASSRLMWKEHEWPQSGWGKISTHSNYDFPYFLFIFLPRHWLLHHEMLIWSTESETTRREAAEARLLFQDRGVTLPLTAWQANTHFLLWVCDCVPGCLPHDSTAENAQNN